MAVFARLPRLLPTFVSNSLTIQAKSLRAAGEPQPFIQVLYLIYTGKVLFQRWGNYHDQKSNEHRCRGSNGACPVG
jgi:hypothetical protein